MRARAFPPQIHINRTSITSKPIPTKLNYTLPSCLPHLTCTFLPCAVHICRTQRAHFTVCGTHIHHMCCACCIACNARVISHLVRSSITFDAHLLSRTRYDITPFSSQRSIDTLRTGSAGGWGRVNERDTCYARNGDGPMLSLDSLCVHWALSHSL